MNDAKGETSNEWFRGNWTVRYLGNEIEIFENADKVKSAKYYKSKSHTSNRSNK